MVVDEVCRTRGDDDDVGEAGEFGELHCCGLLGVSVVLEHEERRDTLYCLMIASPNSARGVGCLYHIGSGQTARYTQPYLGKRIASHAHIFN